MSFSVNTNVGAMAALQSLSATNKGMATTQSRINTGMNVASTKDDSGSFVIAQTLRGDVMGLKAVTGSLNRAKSTVDVAVAGAEQVSDLLNQMQSKALEAAGGVDQPSRLALQRDYNALAQQMTSIIDSSSFNGTNLLKAAGAANDLSALTSTDTPSAANTIAQAGLDFGATVGALGGATWTDAATAETSRAATATAHTTIKGHLSTLGSLSRRIDGQQSFTSKLSDALESGIGNLVDADLAKESARLQALQVKQQLGIQALSIANQAPQAIMSLFR